MSLEGVVNLNVSFTEEEHVKLKTKKKELKLDWHDFFMTLVED